MFLGPGRLPDDLRAGIAAEQPLALEEELTGSVTYRNYRAPGRYSSWRKQAVAGAIAVTPGRLLVWAGRFKHINVPHRHPLRASIKITAEAPDRLCFGYDAAAGGSERSGQVEVRLRTARAEELAVLLDRLARE